MDDHDASGPPIAERANTLYWDSDESVNDIAATMDLSKGSLYNLIHPRGADLDCPECGSELEYPNRTARDKGFVTCPGCGLEEEEEVVRGLAGELVSHTAPDDGARARRTLWATALLGAAAGLIIARWMRR